MFNKLKRETKGAEFPLLGKNEAGEVTIIYHGVRDDREFFKTKSVQSNGWIRVNIYYADGYCEELYER